MEKKEGRMSRQRAGGPTRGGVMQKIVFRVAVWAWIGIGTYLASYVWVFGRN